MRKAVSISQMRELDRRAIEDFGVPGVVLMENAGRAVAEAVRRFPGSTVDLYCGGGNNGGDGLVAARHLANAGRQVRLILAHPPDHFKGDAFIHWKPIEQMKLPYILFQSLQKLLQFKRRPRIVVDALLGTGARCPLEEPYRSLVAAINNQPRPVVAVDVPSGLDADTGTAGDMAVKALLTVTLGLPKKGLTKKSARPWVGKLVVADIGLPINLVKDFMKR
ncbi:MAG: NAD(P)H-hydrate epimerase [Elusimicrobia bacterium]|nr:NAD(P)H-hydrate epimerase [Elusimicrobiota bacterium]